MRVPQEVTTFPGTNTINDLNISKESIMTVPIRIDQPTRIQQHLAGLIHRTTDIVKQAYSLEALISPQLTALGCQLEREKKYSRKFIPLYDREKFYQKNEEFLLESNSKLSLLFLDIRLFEEIWKNYQATIHHINLGVSNGR